jgi:hypothetical protein
MALLSDKIMTSVFASIDAAKVNEYPYRHWILSQCLPPDVVDTVISLPFPAPDLGGVSGKREVHNATRRYFDQENASRFPVCKAFNDAFQDQRLVGRISQFFGTNLNGSYLRVEFAQDTNGFWLEPHTDLGVKLFTMLLYLSSEPSHASLGTDIYDVQRKPVARSPFGANVAMVFVPSDITYHGFEPRPILGVRKSVIINYVTSEWRARDQLASPAQPVGTRAM